MAGPNLVGKTLFSCIYLCTHVCIINMRTEQLIISLALRCLMSDNHTGSLQMEAEYALPIPCLEPSSRPDVPSVLEAELAKEWRGSQILANQEAG